MGVKIGKPINMTSNLKLLKFVSQLKPFREYVVKVQAVTVKPGDAEVCLVMTKAGGKYMSINRYHTEGCRLIIQNVNSSKTDHCERDLFRLMQDYIGY